MSRLIESIRLLDGEFQNLFYHEQRMKHSLNMLFGSSHTVDLERFLLEMDYPKIGLHKCRILYNDIEKEVTFAPYQARKIERIRLVADDNISYEFKFEDRRNIDRLFALRGDCDDVMIARRGMITDCSFSNIVFRRRKQWYTPAVPLLKGTMRQQLLDLNKVLPCEILSRDLRSFDTFKIINAMVQFDSPEIEVSEIVF
jgi:4-amino-4-deoxychorismate lyase